MIVLFCVDAEYGNGGNQNDQNDSCNDAHDVTGQEQEQGHNKPDQDNYLPYVQ